MTAVLRSFNSQLGTMLETSGVMTSPVFSVKAKSVGSNVDGKYGQLNSTGYPSAKYVSLPNVSATPSGVIVDV